MIYKGHADILATQRRRLATIDVDHADLAAINSTLLAFATSAGISIAKIIK